MEENNEREFYTLTDEEGNEIEFELIGVTEYKGNTYPMQRVRKTIADMCVSAFYRTQLNKSTVTWSKDLTTYWYAKIPGVEPATASGWTVKATQTIPGSGVKNVYTCSDKLQTDYTGFAH